MLKDLPVNASDLADFKHNCFPCVGGGARLRRTTLTHTVVSTSDPASNSALLTKPNKNQPLSFKEVAIDKIYSNSYHVPCPSSNNNISGPFPSSPQLLSTRASLSTTSSTVAGTYQRNRKVLQDKRLSLRIPGGPGARLSPTQKAIRYRIKQVVQEMNGSSRHAKAAQLQISSRLRDTPDHIRLNNSDYGHNYQHIHIKRVADSTDALPKTSNILTIRKIVGVLKPYDIEVMPAKKDSHQPRMVTAIRHPYTRRDNFAPRNLPIKKQDSMISQQDRSECKTTASKNQSNSLVKQSSFCNPGMFKSTEKARTVEYQEIVTERTISFLRTDDKSFLGCNFDETTALSSFNIMGEIEGEAFTICRLKQGAAQLLYNHNSSNRMEMASLTKIMTCILIILIAEKFKIDLKQAKAKVNEKASILQGTTARLIYSDMVYVYDLLHGMMLPSGNDASLALAEWGGKMIRQHCSKLMETSSSPRKSRSPQPRKRSHVSLFIYHMNQLAKQLGLVDTRFANSHGLMNKKNFSSSSDLTKLSIFGMQLHLFKEIVQKRQFKCIIANRKFANTREAVWNNTNKLLKIDGFIGIKTGMTPSAGPCLASCYKIAEDQYIYIVLLKTLTVSHRFEESKKLLVEVLRQLYLSTADKTYYIHLQLLSQTGAEIEQLEDGNNIEAFDEPSSDEQKPF